MRKFSHDLLEVIDIPSYGFQDSSKFFLNKTNLEVIKELQKKLKELSNEELENTLRTMRAEAFVEYKDLD